MHYLYEKVSYLRGLSEGMEISAETKEGKLLLEIIDVLGEFADAIVDLNDSHEELNDYVETLEEDLADLEEAVYEDEDDDDDDDFDDFDFDEPVEYVSLKCPACNKQVKLDKDLVYFAEDDIHCPNCLEVLLRNEEQDAQEEISDEEE